MGAATTLPAMIQDRLRSRLDEDALFFRRGGEPARLCWRDVLAEVHTVAAALVRLGVLPGDRVAQFSENRWEWVIVDLAIQMAGAVHVPIHAPLTGEQAGYQIDHSGAQVVFVSTATQAKKLESLGPQWPATPVQFYSFDPLDGSLAGVPIPSWDILRQPIPAAEQAAVAEETVRRTKTSDLATILYTSGTTGEPKGVMLSQENLTSNTWGAVERFGMSAADRRLNFLPLSHVFARTCDLYTWLATGCQLILATSRESVLAECCEFRPTIMNGVPYFFDKVRRILVEEGLADDPDALRGKLGGEIRYCCSGGAALPPHVFDFFWERGVPLLQGYGLTETSPVISMSTPTAVRREASGQPIRDVEVRIAEDGEILTKGPHVMLGYYQRPDATAEVLHEGWFSTGDYGHLDEDHFVYITGRKKEIIVTSGGKNIAPVFLEALLTEDPVIAQVVVVGDGRDYLVALIVPNLEVLGAELAKLGEPAMSPADVILHPRTIDLFATRIRERLAGVSYYEQVRKFRLLDRPFSIESGELTPKLSLRRPEILRNHAHLVDDLYRSPQ